MFVKQITMEKAFELAGKGRKILVLAPALDNEKDWANYMPDTLQNLLEGCLFFREEPAVEVWDGLDEGRVVGTGEQEAQVLKEQLQKLPEAPRNQPPDVWVPVEKGAE